MKKKSAEEKLLDLLGGRDSKYGKELLRALKRGEGKPQPKKRNRK